MATKTETQSHPRVKLTSNQTRSIISRYNKGDTAAKLADEFNVSTATMIRWLKNEGVEMRPRGRQPSEG